MGRFSSCTATQHLVPCIDIAGMTFFFYIYIKWSLQSLERIIYPVTHDKIRQFLTHLALLSSFFQSLTFLEAFRR